MTQGRWRRGGWAALGSSRPRSAPLLRGRAAAHKERREPRVGVQIRTRAPRLCSECLPAALQLWNKSPRRQHQVKRCKGEAVAPQLKVLPSRPLSQWEFGCQTGSHSRPAPQEEGSPPLPTRGGDARMPWGIRNWKARRLIRSIYPSTVSFQMQKCGSFLFLSLIFCATLSETFGLVLSVSTDFTVGGPIRWAASQM